MTSTHLDAFRAAKPYPLDDFQVAGCTAVEEDRGVLVCAPTGAGKTVVGEFAVSLALGRGTKCFYTTPIKALSNQKYHDLVDEHGEDAVGLLTGDVSINASAEVVVMTTEVLRNMIYAQSPQLDRLTHVVMDEIHYLADRDRGAVWEEIILNLDESISIIGLSATVSNSEEFGEWLSTVRGDTEVIVSEHRPVPLSQYMMVGRNLYPLFEPGEDGRVNRELERKIERLEAGVAAEGRSDYEEGRGFRARAEGRRSGKDRTQDRYRPLGRPEVLSTLGGLDMLPAITFIFSRAGCDGALAQCHRSRMELTTKDEAQQIREIVDRGVEGIPEEDLEVLNFRQLRSVWSRGFAAHHAGMLPGFRHIVEELFVKGLVKAVFATETLALGINMPARTVVLEKLVKFNGEAHVDLTPGQYTQLTGRAGRRGIDVLGNAVVQWAPAMDPREVAGLASTRTYPLISTFTPGYNMAVNLLAMNGYEDSLRLIEKSFAQYQTDGSVVDEVREIERARVRVDKLREQLRRDLDSLSPAVPATADEPAADPADALIEYLQLRAELSEAEKQSKREAIEDHQEEVTKILGRLRVGEVIVLPSKRRPELAAVVAPAGRQDDPRPWITTERGWSGRIDAASFRNAPVVVGEIKLPRHISERPRKHTRRVVDQLHKGHFRKPKKLKEQARSRPNKKVVALRETLRDHPVHSWPATDREMLARVGDELAREQRKLGRLENRVDKATDSLGRTFERIIGLLTEMDYVELVDGDPQITDEGARLAEIHNVSDLFVAQCLKRGIWNDLDPAELAGVASLCVFENRKVSGGSPDAATDRMADAMNDTMRIYDELIADERRHILPLTKEPEAGFALSMHQWAAGAPLGYCLAAAAESGAELTPGDFVRWCRQVVDLLGQIAKTGYTSDIKRNAGRAIDAIQRGVVAIGS